MSEMKKVLALLLLTVLLAGCTAAPANIEQPPPVPDPPSVNDGDCSTWEFVPMVKVNGVVYWDTGIDCELQARCGVMDGRITESVDAKEVPTKDNESNFGTGFGYQMGTKAGTIDVLLESGWRIFATQEVRHEMLYPNESTIDILHNYVRRLGMLPKELSAEEVDIINGCIARGAWHEGTTECLHDCEVNLSGVLYNYHSDCGTFNFVEVGQYSPADLSPTPPKEKWSVKLSEEDKATVNGIFGKYVPLGEIIYCGAPKIVSIVDTAKDRTDLAFATALETIFETETTEYYFGVIRSHYIIVHYADGTSEDVKTALNNGNCTIADLDRFGIGYMTREKYDDVFGDPDCGSEVMTLKYRGASAEYLWQHSFMGVESAAATYILRNLEYTEDICKCLPEYEVESEFGDFGVSLKESYARQGQKQAKLTEAQISELTRIFQWAEEQVVCGYPPAEYFMVN